MSKSEDTWFLVGHFIIPSRHMIWCILSCDRLLYLSLTPLYVYTHVCVYYVRTCDVHSTPCSNTRSITNGFVSLGSARSKGCNWCQRTSWITGYPRRSWSTRSTCELTIHLWCNCQWWSCDPSPQGRKGALGPIGDPGLQGNQGERGPQGEVGITGPQGARVSVHPFSSHSSCKIAVHRSTLPILLLLLSIGFDWTARSQGT